MEMNMPTQETLTTQRKALLINLDPTRYGTFAEIGAGQEVVRYFFSVGAAAGTIATATITSSSVLIGDTAATVSFTFTPTSTTLATGKIAFKYPSWYQVNLTPSTTQMLSVAATSDCSPTSGNLVIDACTIDTVTQIVTMDYSSFTGVGDITITINNFKNPVNRNTKSGFKISH